MRVCANGFRGRPDRPLRHPTTIAIPLPVVIPVAALRMCCVPFPRVDRLALSASALPTRPSNPRVFCRELVPDVAMRLAGVRGTWAFSTENVLASRHRFKVERVHAGAHTAKMIQFEAARNGSAKALVKHNVRVPAAPVLVSASAVPGGVCRRLPDPTPDRVSLELFKQSRWKRHACLLPSRR